MGIHTYAQYEAYTMGEKLPAARLKTDRLPERRLSLRAKMPDKPAMPNKL
jgi:hypothetical protein